MGGKILRVVFERDYSLAHASIAAGVTYSLMERHFAVAALVFFVGIIVCVAGEIALEHQ